DRFRVDSFSQQILSTFLSRCTVEISHNARHSAIKLFRPRCLQITGSQPCLDMYVRQAAIEGHHRSCHHSVVFPWATRQWGLNRVIRASIPSTQRAVKEDSV